MSASSTSGTPDRPANIQAIKGSKPGEKLWYVWGVKHGSKWKRAYPGCQSKQQFYDTLRQELGAPNAISKQELVVLLSRKWWDGSKWVEDTHDSK